MNTGSCLCGDIQWSIDGEFSMRINCHCSICRKVHGSAYGAFIGAPVNGFQWITGEDKIRQYQSSAVLVRFFCPRCGSAVAAEVGESAYMPVGNLNEHIERSLDSHIFVAHKACWYEPPDDAPHFDAIPPGYEDALIDTPERLPQTTGAIGGSCSCGKVRYEYDGPADRMEHCYCSRCRKSRSAPFSTQAFVASDRFRWLMGEDNIDRYKVPGSKYFSVSFCRDCSSLVPVVNDEFAVAVIPAGSIDQDPGIRPQAHVYVGSKAPWVEIDDDLPRFEEMRT